MLEVFTTIISIYLVLTLAASGIMEAVSSIFKLRGLYLEKAVRQMLAAPSSQKAQINNGNKTTIEAVRKMEAKDLPELYTKFLNSSSIQSENRPGIFLFGRLFKIFSFILRRNLPSYISPNSFFYGLMEALNVKAFDKNELKSAIDQQFATPQQQEQAENKQNVNSGHPQDQQQLKELLLLFVEKSFKHADSQKSVQAFQKEIENWFDQTMKRASGWYKRNTQVWLFVIGIFLAWKYDSDAFAVVRKAQTNLELRSMADDFAQTLMEADATAWMEEYKGVQKEAFYRELNDRGLAPLTSLLEDTSLDTSTKEKVQNLVDTIKVEIAQPAIRRPITHKADTILSVLKSTETGLAEDSKKGLGSKLKRWLGFILSALAISLGAPFWFDLLQQIMRFRMAGVVPTLGDNKDAETKS